MSHVNGTGGAVAGGRGGLIMFGTGTRNPDPQKRPTRAVPNNKYAMSTRTDIPLSGAGIARGRARGRLVPTFSSTRSGNPVSMCFYSTKLGADRTVKLRLLIGNRPLVYEAGRIFINEVNE